MALSFPDKSDLDRIIFSPEQNKIINSALTRISDIDKRLKILQGKIDNFYVQNISSN